MTFKVPYNIIISADDDDANDTVTYADDVTGYVSDDPILDNMRTNDNYHNVRGLRATPKEIPYLASLRYKRLWIAVKFSQ